MRIKASQSYERYGDAFGTRIARRNGREPRRPVAAADQQVRQDKVGTLKIPPGTASMNPKSVGRDEHYGLFEARSGRWSEELTAERMVECVWLRPAVVARFDFLEWTPDGHLRHSSLVGLRDDKEARDVVRESMIRPRLEGGGTQESGRISAACARWPRQVDQCVVHRRCPTMMTFGDGVLQED